ncbi:MAG: hypothetical protein AB7K24_29390 [Gemmataceae bacterium]
MADVNEPVVLELAPLPRELMGPFVILGLDKDASPAEIEAHWARRVIWARKNQAGVPLQDINWAREVLNDFERRLRADVTSLNIDSVERILRRLEERYGLTLGQLGWQPHDAPDPERHEEAGSVPDAREWLERIVVPELPWEVPAAEAILEEFARSPLDPWHIPGLDSEPAPVETPR